MSPAYAVVVFAEDNSVAAIPVAWLDGDQAFWAPYSSQERFDRAVRCDEKPDNNWPKFGVRILGIKDSYAKARCVLRKAELSSDINTDDEHLHAKRHRRIPQHLRDDSDDDCELPAVCETAATKTARRPPAALPPDAAETATVQEKQLPPAPSPPNLSVTQLAPDGATSLSACCSTSNPATTPVTSPTGVSTVRTTASSANKVIITLLAEMKSELNDIKRQVALNTQMLQALSSGSVETNDELEVQLPLQNSQALDQLEEQLLRDDQLRKSLVAKLAARGGRTVKEITTRIMTSLLTNAVVIGMNWSGQRSKKAFGDMKLAQVVIAAVRRNRMTNDATDADIQRQIVRFMHGAQDRDGGRRARQKRKEGRPAVGDTDNLSDSE